MKRVRGDRVKWTPEMRKRLSDKYTGDGNPMYGKESWSKGKRRPEITGNKNKRYKRGYWISNTGYKILEMVNLTGGKKVTEQDFVMEKQLGRRLKENEVVHHKDGNKLNNDISNLKVMSRGEHARYHNFGIIRTDREKKLTGAGQRRHWESLTPEQKLEKVNMLKEARKNKKL